MLGAGPCIDVGERALADGVLGEIRCAYFGEVEAVGGRDARSVLGMDLDGGRVQGRVAIDHEHEVFVSQSDVEVQSPQRVVADLVEADHVAVGPHRDDERARRRGEGPHPAGEFQDLWLGVVHGQADGIGRPCLREQGGQAARQMSRRVRRHDREYALVIVGSHRDERSGLTRVGQRPTLSPMLIQAISDLPDAPEGSRVLVPTMGALHEGHLHLIRRARALSRGGQVVVSVFVNPTQFNEAADFERYPRDLASDVEAATGAGATHVYAPPAEEVYPPGVDVRVGVLPRVATEPGLEDAFRPGHFDGVVQVVRRLFELVRPQVACFGEKDWQQLAVVRAMAGDEELGVHIEAVETVREEGGLAMSSRNRLLSPADRQTALAIYAGLRAARSARSPAAAELAMARALEVPGLEVEYAVVRDAQTLLKPSAGRSEGLRALVAARVGARVRLIDNGPACGEPLPSGH